MKWFTALSLAMLFAARASSAQEVKFTAPPGGLLMLGNDFPPMLMFANDEASGIFPDLIREASSRSGVAVQFVSVTWARALATARSEPGVCAIPASQTPERESLFAWIKSVYRSEWKFFALATNDVVISNMDDARRFRVGVENGTSRDEFLTAAGGFTLERAVSNDANLRKLAAGRIDLWADSADVPPRIADGTDIKIKPVLTFRSGEIGVACSPGTDPVLLERMRAAIASMRQNGQLETIPAKYLFAR